MIFFTVSFSRFASSRNTVYKLRFASLRESPLSWMMTMFASLLLRHVFQDGLGTEPELETGTVGAVFPETGRGTGNVGTVFQEPKPEPEPLEPFFQKPEEEPEMPEPFFRNRSQNRNRPFLLEQY